ncbi:MAG: ABC transporter ATP-binding protein [Pseudolabrys sp.]
MFPVVPLVVPSSSPNSMAVTEDVPCVNARIAPGSTGLTVRNVTKRFGSFQALDDVNLEVRAGEFVTLLGPSGSGKTTLLNVLAGFIYPDSGSLLFGDVDITRLSMNKRDLGMVFQSYALFPHMSVADNVAFPLRVRKMAEADIKLRVAEALRLVQLGGFEARSIASLSGGQKQRVALARAVVFNPRIVLMDEPLSALDKNLREHMQVEIRHLHAKIGATTIYVTHDQREALTMSDRIAVVNKGRIVQFGTPKEIYEQPKSAFIAGFIGETTLIPVTVSASGISLSDGTPLRTQLPCSHQGKFVLALRSEKLLTSHEMSEHDNRLEIDVLDVIYQGDSLLILGSLSGHQVSVRRPLRSIDDQAGVRAGSRLLVGLHRSDTIVVPVDPS